MVRFLVAGDAKQRLADIRRRPQGGAIENCRDGGRGQAARHAQDFVVQAVEEPALDAIGPDAPIDMLRAVCSAMMTRPVRSTEAPMVSQSMPW
jgi:hypothetical protein